MSKCALQECNIDVLYLTGDLTSGSSRIAKFCTCLGLNSYPPYQDLGALTKELASLLRFSGPCQASLQSSLQYSVSGVLIVASREVL